MQNFFKITILIYIYTISTAQIDLYIQIITATDIVGIYFKDYKVARRFVGYYRKVGTIFDAIFGPLMIKINNMWLIIYNNNYY